MNIVCIKNAKIFYAVENFTGNRKTMAFYAHSLIDTPNTIDFEAKQFFDFFFHFDLSLRYIHKTCGQNWCTP
jgi:hypothetical protein